jgi:ABC-type uncharacterized transport system substrate-binding protein
LVNTELRAASSDILILKSGHENVYTDIVETVTTHLNKSCKRPSNNCSLPPIRTVSLTGPGQADAERLLAKPWKLIITVGGKAAARAAERTPTAPVLHTVLPRKTFEYIYRNQRNNKASAIFIDQPLVRKFALIQDSMPERKRVGILIAETREVDREGIRRLAAQFGLAIQFGVVDSEKEIGNILRELLGQSDVLLALPDPVIFNQHTVKNILLSSYHNRVPVIGFSMAYVKAGAIVAVYSSPDEIGKHIGEWVEYYLKYRGRVLSRQSFPTYFSVSTNESVAESLNIPLPATEILETKLKERGL